MQPKVVSEKPTASRKLRTRTAQKPLQDRFEEQKAREAQGPVRNNKNNRLRLQPSQAAKQKASSLSRRLLRLSHFERELVLSRISRANRAEIGASRQTSAG
jgi:hypothetical protein